MYRRKKIAVIIPALEEEESLPIVLDAIPACVDRIIVADNGSADRTYQIACDKTCYPRVSACRQKQRGYGSACLKAMELLEDEDIIVFLDADFCDDPAKIYLLLDPIVEKQGDVVISNRVNSQSEAGSLSLQQRLGNRLAVFLIRLLWGFSYLDLGPFRSISKAKLAALGMQDRNYGWTVELQIKVLQLGMQVVQADVPYKRRGAGKSKVSRTVKGTLLAGSKIIYTIFKLKIARLSR